MAQRKTSYQDTALAFERRLQKIKESRAGVSLLLDGIEDYRNLGALFRIADAANLDHIYGYRMPELFSHRKLGKVARSTQRFIPHSNLSQGEEIVALQDNFELIALELTDQSIPYHEYYPEGPCALIIGNESLGVSTELLSLASRSIHIPMHGINHSMNVAVATGIAVYHLRSALAARQT